MDSLKVPKAKSTNNTNSVPMSIRFNAGEESIDEFIKTSDSLSSSPQQNDDTNWRKELLQGSFFGRKRSGSIEGPLATNGNITSGKTWKMIKGKVSQAMEDIKSSKSDTKADDSDVESNTVNSSISEDFSDKLTPKIKDNVSDSDSDNDIDPDILTSDNFIAKQSMLKKSLDHLKTAKKKINSKELTKDKEKETSSIISKSFLRRRKKSPLPPEKIQKKDSNVEIESAVEMMEDMILGINQDDEFKDADDGTKLDLNLKENIDNKSTTTTSPLNFSSAADPSSYNLIENNKIQTNNSMINHPNSKENFKIYLNFIYNYRSILTGIIFLIILYIFNIPQFLKGVLTCLFCFILFNNIYDMILKLVNKIILHGERGVEKNKFSVPDYKKMPICEIPAAEEHKVLKSYAGWMNEINNYDPSNFHISMTRSVYVKLDGTNLRLSNTNARIPKRSMWNETIIDKKSITFSQHRTYNILDCRLEMCPAGLARKRHFSRKYPIQLTIKNTTNSTTNSETTQQDEKEKNEQTLDSLENDSSSFEEPSANEFCDVDIGAMIMNSDVNYLQKIQETQEINKSTTKDDVPCADEARILLFARNDREKEDWYRRFKAASMGFVTDQEIHTSDFVTLSDDDIISALKSTLSVESNESDQKSTDTNTAATDDKDKSKATTSKQEKLQRDDSVEKKDGPLVDGLLMTSCSSRGPSDYLRFMSRYQQACVNIKIPVVTSETLKKKTKREKKTEDDLWKGIDQSLYLGASGSIVWANVLIGRILYGCLGDTILLKKIHDFLEKKLTAIRLPSFMEDVHLAEINLGDTPPIVHRISQPLLDERGIWIDADLTYEGLSHMTISTKLNLMRLKKPEQQTNECSMSLPNESAIKIICDSDAESSGATSSDSESSTQNNTQEAIPDSQGFYTPPGSSKKILRIVDRITASNLFQSATEISYIQRAMENMSTKIKLRVELKGLVARVTINIPPPPSDRLWIGFRGPPRLWLTAKPAVGDHTFDWSIVTNIIENKLCDEVYKYLVYPNMVDIILPFLGQSTYQTKD